MTSITSGTTKNIHLNCDRNNEFFFTTFILLRRINQFFSRKSVIESATINLAFNRIAYRSILQIWRHSVIHPCPISLFGGKRFVDDTNYRNSFHRNTHHGRDVLQKIFCEKNKTKFTNRKISVMGNKEQWEYL